jgi:hypothetical protein
MCQTESGSDGSAKLKGIDIDVPNFHSILPAASVGHRHHFPISGDRSVREVIGQSGPAAPSPRTHNSRENSDPAKHNEFTFSERGTNCHQRERAVEMTDVM